MSLEAVPCDIADANAFVAQHHRHNRPVTVARFAIAAAKDGKVVGVSIVGNPVARSLCDGWTLEVVRLATDGHHNACSFLYGASWRAARALGWRKLITYTRKDEGGGQLTSCGVEGRCRGEGSVLVLPVAPSRGPGTSAGQVQMGGGMREPRMCIHDVPEHTECGACNEMTQEAIGQDFDRIAKYLTERDAVLTAKAFAMGKSEGAAEIDRLRESLREVAFYCGPEPGRQNIARVALGMEPRGDCKRCGGDRMLSLLKTGERIPCSCVHLETTPRAALAEPAASGCVLCEAERNGAGRIQGHLCPTPPEVERGKCGKCGHEPHQGRECFAIKVTPDEKWDGLCKCGTGREGTK